MTTDKTIIQIEIDKEDILFYADIDVSHHVSKKNGRTITQIPVKGGRRRPSIGKSADLVQMENYLEIMFARARSLQNSPAPIDQPLWAIFIFYFPYDVFFTKKGQISLKLPDLSNLYELPQDCLQNAGVITNDTIIHSHDKSRRLPDDKYHLEVILLRHTLDFKMPSEARLSEH